MLKVTGVISEVDTPKIKTENPNNPTRQFLNIKQAIHFKLKHKRKEGELGIHSTEANICPIHITQFNMKLGMKLWEIQ